MSTCGTARAPRGAALVVTMLVMAVLLLAGTTFMTISSTESQIALNEQLATRTLSLADAGLHRAIANLNANASYAGETNVSLGGGTMTITVTTPTASGTQICPGNTARDVTATGRIPIRGTFAQSQIRALADKVAAPFRYGVFSTVPNTIVQAGTSAFFASGNVDRTESELWLDDDVQVDGFDSDSGRDTSVGVYNTTTNRNLLAWLGGNGDVTLDPRVRVYGTIRAGDAVTKAPDATYNLAPATNLGPAADSPGDQFPLVVPPGTASSSLTVPLPGYTCPPSCSWSISAGTYYWTNFTMLDGVSLVPSGGRVTIYITGNISLGNNVVLGSHPGTNMRFVMKSDASLLSTNPADQATFEAGNNFRFYGGLYGRNANVRIGTDSQIYGSIIGRTVHLRPRTQLHHDLAMLRSEICGAPKYAVRLGTWREVIP